MDDATPAVSDGSEFSEFFEDSNDSEPATQGQEFVSDAVFDDELSWAIATATSIQDRLPGTVIESVRESQDGYSCGTGFVEGEGKEAAYYRIIVVPPDFDRTRFLDSLADEYEASTQWQVTREYRDPADFWFTHLPDGRYFNVSEQGGGYYASGEPSPPIIHISVTGSCAAPSATWQPWGGSEWRAVPLPDDDYHKTPDPNITEPNATEPDTAEP